ncbi:MAG: cytochrome b N-terminal domain-containing protein [Desulfurivibrionaceae bacterium]
MYRFFRYLDRRFDLSACHPGFLARKIPAGVSYLHCFGGIAFVLYLLLLLTGMLLSVYYVPAEAEAFRSVVAISREVRLGFLVRGMHRWAGHLLLVLVLLHTARVIGHRAYLPPRELNWLAGAFILLLLLASGFTGALLPWDQKAYWTTVVASGIAGTVPGGGETLLPLVRGGQEVSGSTLLRFYSLHVLWLPLAINLLLWAHFHMVKRLGVKGVL